MSVQIGHASMDENKRATGGMAGDQTGKEICIRSWYRGGWTVLLRAKDGAVRQKIADSCAAAPPLFAPDQHLPPAAKDPADIRHCFRQL